MPATKLTFTAKKHNGSWAVFPKGGTTPVMTGLTAEDARAWRDYYNENGR